MKRYPASGLQQYFTAALLNGRRFPHQSSGMFRPSEASVTIQTPQGPLVKGACKRKTWYRLKGIPASEGESLPHQIQRMNVGTQVEKSIIETCKKEGLYIDNNVPFRVTMDGVPIAGELDAVLRTEPCGGINYLVEIKSIYSYYAQKDIFGKYLNLGKEFGRPRDSYIMQASLYLNHFSRLPEDDPSYLPFGNIFVCDRGDGHFGVFDIWLEEKIKQIGEDEHITIHEIYYASEPMGIPTTKVEYTIEDVLMSYKQVMKALETDTVPSRDFVKEYDRDTIMARYEQGLVTEKNYNKWIASHGPRGKGKEKAGDWNCNGYCLWESYCQSNN